MDKDSIIIKKNNGEFEKFSFTKLKYSLKKSDASDKDIEFIQKKIEPFLYNGITSKKIYQKAYQILRNINRVSASKYSLKRAIFELGPTGYPFEKLVATLLKEKGYQTEVSVFLPGACIVHEIDVLATKNNYTYAIECKFHSNSSTISNVKTPLYINSRFLDIQQRWNSEFNKKTILKQGWLVTNTRFSEDAINYAKCIDLRLLSWDYPDNNGIKNIITKYSIYPITTLTSLTAREKKILIKNNIIIIKEILNNPSILETIGLPYNKIKKIIEETKKLCKSLV